MNLNQKAAAVALVKCNPDLNKSTGSQSAKKGANMNGIVYIDSIEIPNTDCEKEEKISFSLEPAKLCSWKYKFLGKTFSG